MFFSVHDDLHIYSANLTRADVLENAANGIELQVKKLETN